MGTTRKNAAGVPDSILAIKNASKKDKKDKDDKPTPEPVAVLVYNKMLAVIQDYCLCFVW